MIEAEIVIDAEGVYLDVPHEEYVRDPMPGGSLSSTGAKRLLPPSCPAKYRWYADHPQIKTEFDFGHAAHGLVLGAGPDVEIIQRTTKLTDPLTKAVTLTVDDAPNRLTKSAQEHERAIRAAGKVPLLAADWQVVQDMAWAIEQDPMAQDLLDASLGRPEVTLVARGGASVMLRSRVDWLLNAELDRVGAVDYKSTTCAEPGAFSRQMYNFGYHVQAAFYLHVMRLLGLATEKTRFLFLAQEKIAPYLCTWGELDADALAVGMDRVREAIEIYRDCKASGVWPGYTTDVVRLSLPRYARYDQGEF